MVVKEENFIILALVHRQGVTGKGLTSWPIEFPNLCLSAVSSLAPNNSKNELWTVHMIFTFTKSTIIGNGNDGANKLTYRYVGVGC